MSYTHLRTNNSVFIHQAVQGLGDTEREMEMPTVKSHKHSQLPTEKPSTLPPLQGYLYTPPEQLTDSFSTRHGDPVSPKQWQSKLVPIQSAVPSPPTTPETKSLPGFSAIASTSPADRLLFPNEPSTDATDAEVPLFASESQHTHQLPVVHAEDTRLHRNSQSSSSSAELINTSRTWIGSFTGRDAMERQEIEEAALAVYRMNLAEIDAIRAAHRASLPAPTASKVSKRDPYTARQLQLLGKTTSNSKVKQTAALPAKAAPKPSASPAKSTSPAKATSPAQTTSTSRRTAPARRTSKAIAHHDFTASGETVTKHKRAAPSKKVDKGDDRDWRSMPDYSPPLASLAQTNARLWAVWEKKSAPLDFADAADVDVLDPQELELAHELRLYPVQYLANKRRMFKAKVESLKVAHSEGNGKGAKAFNKTAAQLACNIDVNKASQLFEAFNRVGWLEDRWFVPYL